MLQVVQLSRQQDRFRARQAESSCTLLNKKGLGYWQDSLFRGDEILSLHSLYYFSPARHFLQLSAHGKGERLCESASLHQEPKLNLPLSPLSRMAEETTFVSLVPMTSAWVGNPVLLFFFLSAWMCVSLSLAVSLQVWVRPLHRAQFAIALGILNDCCVTEVVLVPGLDAESPLCTHPPHCLTHIHGADVLQPGQADVQCTERAWSRSREENVCGEREEGEVITNKNLQLVWTSFRIWAQFRNCFGHLLLLQLIS